MPNKVEQLSINVTICHLDRIFNQKVWVFYQSTNIIAVTTEFQEPTSLIPKVITATVHKSSLVFGTHILESLEATIAFKALVSVATTLFIELSSQIENSTQRQFRSDILE